eukprot:47314-Pyramimonas_sp.AAC.1
MASAREKDGQRLVVLVFVGMMWTARPEPNVISATMVKAGAPALWGLGGIASACTCDVRWHPWVEVCAWKGRYHFAGPTGQRRAKISGNCLIVFLLRARGAAPGGPRTKSTP